MNMLLRRICLALLVILPGLVAIPDARAAALEISATPLSGPQGTVVTVTGRGARPNAALVIGGGQRSYPEGCAVPLKGGQGQIVLFARMSSDGGGNFTATFPVEPYGREETLLFFEALYVDGNGFSDGSNRLCFDVTGNSVTFPETGKTVRGRFLVHWEQHGGLAINGYPISDPLTETLEDGQAYTVQYFERARFEFHDNKSITPQILLGQFGRRIRPADPPVAPIPGAAYFGDTGHNVTRPAFIDYWNTNGGLPQFGFPLSEEIDEALDGTTYRVQYFERARFEWHPENPDPYKVQFGQFGRIVCGDRCR